MIYIGIDPGLTGAMVVVVGEHIHFFDTPTYEDGKRTRIDAGACKDLFEGEIFRHSQSPKAFIEKVQPMPKNGSIASFSLGYSYGLWIGLLTSASIPYTLVTPQAWKKSMMPGEAKEKGSSRIVARRLFPAQCADHLNLVKHHGRADALLIAEYGRRLTERAA